MLTTDSTPKLNLTPNPGPNSNEKPITVIGDMGDSVLRGFTEKNSGL